MNTKDDEKVVTITKKNKKCIHDGHRQRLIDMAMKAGLDNMSNFQVAEFFLTYIFPRGDVNPLAHRLLDRFGNLTNAINADVEDLKMVDGINDRSAKKIRLFGDLFQYYVEAKMAKKHKVETKAELLDIVEDHLRFRSTEHMLLLAFSTANIIIAKRRLTLNENDKVGISVLDFTSFLTSTKPAAIVIAHCHPYGFASPSANDDVAFNKIKALCASFGVKLIAAYIVGEDGVFDQCEGGIVRKHMDVAELQEAIQAMVNKPN